MPTISIPDDTYQRLASRAAARGTTVEAIAVPVLEQLASENGNSHIVNQQPQQSYEDWKKGFDELLTLIYSRANHYPLGFHVDDSRDSIYEGCGE